VREAIKRALLSCSARWVQAQCVAGGQHTNVAQECWNIQAAMADAQDQRVLLLGEVGCAHLPPETPHRPSLCCLGV
jgi:hypothetical protein